MNIIIAGDGRVGSTLAKQLCAEGYDVTIIDHDQSVLDETLSKYDVMAVLGNCASMPTLIQAGIMDADLLIAATSADEINLLCCISLHFIRHMRVDIQRCLHRSVPNGGGESLYIHSVLNRLCREKMPEIVKSDVLASGVIENHRQPFPARRGVSGRIFLVCFTLSNVTKIICSITGSISAC